MSAARETLRAFERSPLLGVLGVVTIAFSLFAVGLFGLVALNIRQALAQVEERVEIRAFLVDGTSAAAVAAASGDARAFPEVASVAYVSQEAALARAREELGEFSDVFESGILPASLDVRLKAGFRDPDAVKRVADRLRTYDFVEDVRYGEDWVAKFHAIQRIAAATGVILGTAFAGVAMIIIGATIRMSVLARAREIAIMRLVGATDGFIRRPFLLDGFAKGVLGGALALLLTWLAARVVSEYVVTTHFFDARLAALGVLGGAAIGLVGSLLAVGRHLRRV
ncbi:MAG TPA: permease-like cell division protein FtsX [Gemmatimonadaceae bacterium]|nr:permease-like cell division protein FtsX [Gemmatimonadaceae bacterium]